MASNYGARLSRRHRLAVFLVAATGMALFSASCGGSGGSGDSGAMEAMVAVTMGSSPAS